MSSGVESVPVHLGLILDGNRRWAKSQNLPSLEGHKRGYENLKTIAKSAFDLGVNYVSAYVFSTENWQRSKEEVDYLMKLLLWISKHEIKDLNKQNIKVLFIGEEDRLAENIITSMRNAEDLTSSNSGGTLVVCLNYGGQQEIVSAFNKILNSGLGNEGVTVDMIESSLYSPDVPELDLIIRTSGEQRLSNFMLWRAAYSELYFTDVHWPDFGEEDLKDALDDFAQRKRRFGK